MAVNRVANATARMAGRKRFRSCHIVASTKAMTLVLPCCVWCLLQHTKRETPLPAAPPGCAQRLIETGSQSLGQDPDMGLLEHRKVIARDVYHLNRARRKPVPSAGRVRRQ